MMLLAKSSVRPARRGPSISPSPWRNPSASSSSWPGVRIVTASALAVNADLEWLLDGDDVLDAVVLDLRVGARHHSQAYGARPRCKVTTSRAYVSSRSSLSRESAARLQRDEPVQVARMIRTAWVASSPSGRTRAARSRTASTGSRAASWSTPSSGARSTGRVLTRMLRGEGAVGSGDRAERLFSGSPAGGGSEAATELAGAVLADPSLRSRARQRGRTVMGTGCFEALGESRQGELFEPVFVGDHRSQSTTASVLYPERPITRPR